MKWLLLPLLMFGFHAAAFTAEPEEHNSVEACYAYSQARMHDCLVGEQKESAIALKAAEEKAISALSRWDEDAKFVAMANDALKKANASFARYRDSQCAFAYTLGGGAIGNALEARRMACTIELNKRRAADLMRAVAALPLR